jgi:hypothetical protein
MSPLVSRLRFALAASLLVAPRLAHAGDTATAEALFEEGKRLMAAQQYAAACAKLEESQRIDPGVGTLFNLADCHEQLGKTASAWGEFTEVAALSKAAGQTAREEVARQRAAALEPKLSKVVLRVLSPAAAMEIKRDDAVVGPGQLGTQLPIDPGEHTFSASAPGKKPWTTKINVTPGTTLAVVEVPPLEDAPEPPVAPPPSGDHAPADGSSQRTVGFVVGGLGVVGIVVGAAASIVSLSKKSQANEDCDPNTDLCNTPRGVDLRASAITAGNVSTIAFITGGVLGATGLVLVLTAPRSQSQPGPQVGVGFHGTRFTIGGAW